MHKRRPFWFLRRRDIESEVDEELQLHLDMRAAQLQAEGLPAEEARKMAVRQFGDLEATRRYCRRQDDARENVMQRTLLFQDVVQDLRIAVRSLLRAPVLALTIVTSVGLGLGATAAIFSAVDAAVLRPLPYPQADTLVRIYTDAPPFKFPWSVADYLAFAEQQTQFEHSATYSNRAVSFHDGDSAELLQTRIVSWGFLSVLGITPVAGRDFTEQDGRVGAPLVAVASHAFWQQRLGGRSDAVGSPLRLDGAEYTLVGVLPPSNGPLERRFDLFLIQQFTPPLRKGPFFLSVIARLPRGAHPSAATSELRAINRGLFPMWQSSYQDDSASWNMEDLRTNLLGDVSTLAGLALTAVALVWLIACTNASNLLVGRATGRLPDLAIRTALGASRGRLLRYLLAESAVLAAASAVVGLGIAWVGMRLLEAYAGEYFPRTDEIQFDAVTIGSMSALALSSALLFGLLPALHATRRPTRGARLASRTTTGGRSARRLRRGLVAAQFAIATPLLIVAVLLVTSLQRLKDVDLGFDTTRVLTGSVRLPMVQYSDVARARGFWDELKRQLEAVPGVASVAFADGLAPDNVSNVNNFELERRPTPTGQPQPLAPWVAVTPEYVGTLGLTLLEGRFLDDRDAVEENELSVVVDRAWARRFFPNTSAVGERLRGGGCTTCPWTTVVGVVSDVKYAGLDQPEWHRLHIARWKVFALRRDQDGRRSAQARGAARAGGPAARAGGPADRRGDDGHARRSGPGPATVVVGTGGRLCHRSAAPVGDRHLRRDGLLRAAASQGDLHSHGSRWQSHRCGAARHRPGHGRGGPRDRHRPGTRGGHDAFHVQPAVRRRCRGLLGLCDCRRAALRRRPGRLRSTGIARHALVAGGCPAKRVTRRHLGRHRSPQRRCRRQQRLRRSRRVRTPLQDS
ncbi:MAG: ABC transporter permease [Acidobacteria bacterium]|nr:ABC transporter permease [Acidobacteriota bacterium]